MIKRLEINTLDFVKTKIHKRKKESQFVSQLKQKVEKIKNDNSKEDNVIIFKGKKQISIKIKKIEEKFRKNP